MADADRAPRVLLPKDLRAAPFTGRASELQAIDQAFADRDQAQVFVLFGSPGVGKSRLAHEYATRHLGHYPGGTFFLRWDGTPPSELGKLLLLLSLPRFPEEPFEDQCRRVLAHLGAEPTLLIYDNVPGEEALAEWLPSAGARCHVLVTSTCAEWSVGCDACQVGLLPTDDGHILVSRLVRDPIAAGRYAEQIVARARGVTMELCAVARSVDYELRHGREASLRAALATDTASSFGAAWGLLREDARLLLRVACLFAIGRIPPDALRALLAGEGWEEARIDAALDGVRDRGLLTAAAEVFEVHQLVAHFVREQVAPVVPGALVLRHFEMFAKTADAFAEHPGDGQQRTRLLAYPVEIGLWAALPAAAPALAERARTVGDGLIEAGRFAEALPWFECAVEAKHKGDMHGRVDHESLGSSLHQVGFCHASEGRFAEARSWFERAVEAKHKGDVHGCVDHESLGSSLHAMGFCHSREGGFDQARSWFERAVEAKQKGDVHGCVDHQSLGRSLHQVGSCDSSVDRFDQARSWYERAVEAKHKGDMHGRVDPESLGRSLHAVGVCHASEGRFNDARLWFERAVEAKQKGDVHGRVDPESLGCSLHEAGICHANVGCFAEARSWYERAVEAKQKGDVHGRVDPESLGRSLHEVGICHSSEGCIDQARTWYERAVEAKHKGDVHGRVDHESLGQSLHQVGVCHARGGRFAEARTWYERAVEAKQRGDVHGRVDHDSLGTCFQAVGFCHASEGRFAEARSWFERAVEARQKGDVYGCVDHQSLSHSLEALRDCREKLGLAP